LRYGALSALTSGLAAGLLIEFESWVSQALLRNILRDRKAHERIVELALPGRVGPLKKEMLVRRPGKHLVGLGSTLDLNNQLPFTVLGKDELQVVSSPPLAGLDQKEG
jgi:hypothetical protein